MGSKFRCLEALNRCSKIMENSNEFGNVKYIGLSYLEYQVVLLSFGISGLLCFEEDQAKYEDVSQQELYNLGLASLYNRKLIISQDDGFRFSKDISDGFRVLKNCRKILCADLINTSICCMYFDGGDKFAVMEPGNREGEYVKLSVRSMNDFEGFLKESDYIKDTTTVNDTFEFAADLPVEGEAIENFIEKLQNELVSDFDMIKEIEEIEALFTVYDRNIADNKYYAAIIEQPIQDKLLVYDDGDILLQSYSDIELINLIKNQVR